MTSTALMELSEDLQQLSDVDLYWDRIALELGQYGVTSFLHAATASKKEILEKGPHASLVLKTNYPQIYMDTFGADTYLDDDPSVEHAVCESGAMFWHHDPDWHCMTPDQKSSWIISDDIGFQVGITIPSAAHSPKNIGGVGLCAEEHTPDEFDKMWTAKGDAVTQILSLLDIGMRQQHLSSIIGLAPREKEVLEWLANGLRPKEVAHRLNIGYRTVDKYIISAKCKLNATTRDQAVAKALIFNVINP